jgi:hypothetical protein
VTFHKPLSCGCAITNTGISKMKITTVVSTKIIVNQCTSSRWVQMSYTKHGLLTKPTNTKHRKNNIVYIGFGWGLDKTSTTYRISLNTLTVNSDINAFLSGSSGARQRH